MSADSTSRQRAIAPRRGQLTRERVLDVATGLFAARGFAPVTMRAIGDGAGIDNSSVYRHFASKSDLARAVLDRAMAGLAEAVVPAAETTAATLEAAIDLVTVAALHLWDHPDTARLLLHWVISWKDAATGFDVSLSIDAAGAPSGDLYRALVRLLVRVQASGEIRELEWPEAFVALMGVIVLRPATFGSLLASQEPERCDADARLAWRREVRALLRGMLAA